MKNLFLSIRILLIVSSTNILADSPVNLLAESLQQLHNMAITISTTPPTPASIKTPPAALPAPTSQAEMQNDIQELQKADIDVTAADPSYLYATIHLPTAAAFDKNIAEIQQAILDYLNAQPTFGIPLEVQRVSEFFSKPNAAQLKQLYDKFIKYHQKYVDAGLLTPQVITPAPTPVTHSTVPAFPYVLHSGKTIYIDQLVYLHPKQKGDNAGVIPYYIDTKKKELLIMIGLDHHAGWNDFGGSRDSGEDIIFKTAYREFREESAYMLEIDASAVTQFSPLQRAKYNRYIAPIDYINPQTIYAQAQHLYSIGKGGHIEKTAWVWVNAKDLLAKAKNPSFVLQGSDGKNTVEIPNLNKYFAQNLADAGTAQKIQALIQQAGQSAAPPIIPIITPTPTPTVPTPTIPAFPYTLNSGKTISIDVNAYNYQKPYGVTKDNAGIIPYFIDAGNKRLLIMIGYDPHAGWNDFGGSRDSNENSIFATAYREFREESAGVLEIDASAASKLPPLQRAKYNRYIAPIAYVNPQTIYAQAKQLRSIGQGHHIEKTAWVWVNAKDLLAKAKNPSFVLQGSDGKTTITIPSLYKYFAQNLADAGTAQKIQALIQHAEK